MLKVINSAQFKELLKQDQLIVVDFFATWCGPCKLLNVELERVVEAPEFKAVQFVKIDVDSAAELVNEYNIFNVPTLIIFHHQKELHRSFGFLPTAEISKAITKCLTH